jgi:hypothetical protein
VFPGGEGGDGDEKVASGLRGGPSALDLEGQDGEAEIGWIVRPGARGETTEACAEDVELGVEEARLAAEAFGFGAEAEVKQRTVRAPREREGERAMGEPEGVEEGGADDLGPVGGEWDCAETGGYSAEGTAHGESVRWLREMARNRMTSVVETIRSRSERFAVRGAAL